MSSIQDGIDALNQIIAVAERPLNLLQDYAMSEAAYQWLLGKDDDVGRAIVAAGIEKCRIDPPIGLRSLTWTGLWYRRIGTGIIIERLPDQWFDGVRELRIRLDAGAQEKTDELEEDQKAQPSKPNPPAKNLHQRAGDKPLSPAEESAYQSFEVASKHLAPGDSDPLPTDQRAYDWLKENGPEGYDLPTSFHTWQRYVRSGREFYGTQKQSPRAGRDGRSIVRSDSI